MDYDVSQSSGTDDDLPHQNRVSRSRFAGNKRSVLSSISHHSMYANMEVQIHHLEQEAYCAVLRAFKAQSDALTWEKEGLITELRKELRVSDDEHRELLTRVNSDEIIGRVREWRNTGGHQASRLNASQPVYDPISSPTISASRKKHKTSQPQFSSLSSMKPMHYPPAVQAGSRQFNNRSSAAGFIQESAENASSDPLIGRKVWTRWPEDNNFYEAVITEYNPVEGRHALVYDIYTPNETWEWVDLKEILPEDIRWEDGGLSVSHRGGHRVPGRGVKKSVNRTVVIPDAGRGREPEKSNPKKDFPPSQNGIGKKILDDIELLNTDSLVKEVESVFNTNDPDPFELEKAKKMLKVRSTSRHLLMPLQSLLIHPMVTIMGSIYIHMVGHWRKNEAI